jgi:hypothetical protein
LETRPLYLLGDLAGNTSVGALIGALGALVFHPGWPMAAAMVAGMVGAMILAAAVGFPLSFFLGAFEWMLPGMLTAMACGMIVPMYATMAPISWPDGALAGVVIGLLSLAYTYVLNAFLSGRKTA